MSLKQLLTLDMDIAKFVNLCAGNWFSQRTNYQVETEKTESNKADLSIVLITSDDSRVSQLCQENRIDPQLSLGGLVNSWDNSVDWGKTKQQGSSIMLFVPDTENSHTGKFISNVANTSYVGNYSLGNDQALNLIIEANDTAIEERIWFASDNLRLRTTVIKNSNGTVNTLFYSEIRKAPPKENEK